MIASVDGCKAGWLIAVAETWPCPKPPQFMICPDFSSVVRATSACERVVVDMPIGFPDGDQPQSCARAAREALGAAGQSRVFLTPPRSTLRAETAQEFQRLYLALVGRGAGLPVWGIVPKLRDVDAATTSDLQQRTMEFHPELAWKRLAGRVLASKHGARGALERLAVLAQNGAAWLARPDIGHLHETAKLDGLLDCLVGLPVAQCIAEDSGHKWRLPENNPLKDERGLRMEIWF